MYTLEVLQSTYQ